MDWYVEWILDGIVYVATKNFPPINGEFQFKYYEINFRLAKDNIPDTFTKEEAEGIAKRQGKNALVKSVEQLWIIRDCARIHAESKNTRP